MKDYLLGVIPAGRSGVAAEVADAVVHLASDESRFTVGAELIVDGGMSNICHPTGGAGFPPAPSWRIDERQGAP